VFSGRRSPLQLNEKDWWWLIMHDASSWFSDVVGLTDHVLVDGLFYILHYYPLFLSLSIMTLIPMAEQGMSSSEIN
jgi:hypothetical protein